MRIAVTGARGQLGHELCRQLGNAALPLGRVELDLTNLDSIVDRLIAIRPDAVINTAAYTRVDRAEEESALCHSVNASAVLRLADACNRLGCPLVQISSDYVFGADSGRVVPYCEVDHPGPVNVYGRSKLAGEMAATECKRAIVVRTCGLYGCPVPGASTTNFVSTILRMGSVERSVRVVHDQRCAPSYVPHVGAATIALLYGGATGCWHVVNHGDVSWWEFASEILRQVESEAEAQPIASTEYVALAPRPRYSVLSPAKLGRFLAKELPEWRDALQECLNSWSDA